MGGTKDHHRTYDHHHTPSFFDTYLSNQYTENGNQLTLNSST